VEYVAVTHNGVALANELGSKVQGAKALLPRSDRANPDLPAALKRYGAQVTEVIAYRTVRPTESHQDSLKRIAAGQADAILFFSPSAVQHFAELVGAEKFRALQDTLAIAAVGPVTAKALREAGVERVVVSADTTTVAVVEALEKHFAAAKAAPAGAKQA
jgi:uroporphyrinogen III methyltransferase/synthase